MLREVSKGFKTCSTRIEVIQNVSKRFETFSNLCRNILKHYDKFRNASTCCTFHVHHSSTYFCSTVHEQRHHFKEERKNSGTNLKPPPPWKSCSSTGLRRPTRNTSRTSQADQCKNNGFAAFAHRRARLDKPDQGPR